MRPKEIFRISDSYLDSSDERAMDDALMSTSGDIDLVQDVTTDCSVVAGLSAAIQILTGRQPVRSKSYDKSRWRMVLGNHFPV